MIDGGHVNRCVVVTVSFVDDPSIESVWSANVIDADDGSENVDVASASVYVILIDDCDRDCVNVISGYAIRFYCVYP